jgi:hypothetical protein
MSTYYQNPLQAEAAQTAEAHSNETQEGGGSGSHVRIAGETIRLQKSASLVDAMASFADLTTVTSDDEEERQLASKPSVERTYSKLKRSVSSLVRHHNARKSERYLLGHVLAEGATKVYAHLHIANVMEVDTKRETWTCAINLHLAWCAADAPEDVDIDAKAHLLRFTEGLDQQSTSWKPQWIPEFNVDNLVERSSLPPHVYTVYADDRSDLLSHEDWHAAIERGDVTADKMWVVYEAVEKLTISDPMELEDFPLDKQDMSLGIFLREDVHHVELHVRLSCPTKHLEFDGCKLLADAHPSCSPCQRYPRTW